MPKRVHSLLGPQAPPPTHTPPPGVPTRGVLDYYIKHKARDLDTMLEEEKRYTLATILWIRDNAPSEAVRLTACDALLALTPSVRAIKQSKDAALTLNVSPEALELMVKALAEGRGNKPADILAEYTTEVE